MENVWYTCCDKHNIVTCYDTSFQQQYVHLNGLMRFGYYVLLLSHHFVAYSVSYSKITYDIEAYKKNNYFMQASTNCIGGVMVSVLASSAVDRRFEPRSGQTKDYKIGIYCFSAKQTALRRTSKYWLTRIRDKESDLGDMSIHGLLFQRFSTIKNSTKCVGLVQSGPHHHLIEN